MSCFNGEIGHVQGIESPWANAGGVVKTLAELERMAKTGVGWVEVGSITIEPRNFPNESGILPYSHNPETGETFNRLKMFNDGIDIVEQQIPEMANIAHAYRKPLIVNVAPVSEDPVTEVKELTARAYEAGADAVLVNAGCPCVFDSKDEVHKILSRDADTLMLVLDGLGSITERHKPVYLRVSPIESSSDFVKVYWPLRAHKKTVSAVFTPNSWPVDVEGILEDTGGIGGKSGPAMAVAARQQTRWASEMLRGSGIDVVSSSSIMTANELKNRLSKRIGAVAGAGTTFYYESQNGWQEDTNRLLSDLAA